MDKKKIHVVAAIIHDKDKIYATERGYGEFKGKWEFPGGKVEAHETPEQALVREIEEELETEIKVEDFIQTVEYEYPSFYLVMDCYWCSIVKGNLVLLEAEDATWLTKETLYSVDWLPADFILLDKLKERM